MAVPPPIVPLLEAYQHLLDAHLPALISGLYLHGSCALDAFDPAHSDVDLLAVCARPLTVPECSALARIHRVLTRTYPRWPLEVSYLLEGDVGRCAGVAAPRPHASDGRFTCASRQDMGEVTWWVTWWLLQHRGITLRGPAAGSLPISLDWESMDARMRTNLASYWAAFTTRPRRLLWLLSDYGVQWVVLGVLRQAYSLREHSIIAKVAAGRDGLAHQPARWHPLISEALALRAGQPSRYRWRLQRAWEAHAWLRSMLRELGG